MGTVGRSGKTERRSRATQPLLTLVGDGLWREIDDGGRSATETTQAVAVGGSGGREEDRCGLGVRQGRRESIL
jgi:hypothetical protein